MKTTITTLTSVVILTCAAHGQTVINGDFEDTTGMTDVGISYVGAIPGWGENGEIMKVTEAASAAISTAANGDNILDFDLNATPGSELSIDQVISGFIIGGQYTLNYLAGNRGAAPNSVVSIAGESNTHSFTEQTAFAPASITFTATDVNETLRIDFVSFNSTLKGNFDNFSITQVPEPSSALLTLLGSFCFITRRRRD